MERRDYDSQPWSEDLVLVSHRSLAGAVDAADGRAQLATFLAGVHEFFPHRRTVVRDRRIVGNVSVFQVTVVNSDADGNYLAAELVQRWVDGVLTHIVAFDEGVDAASLEAEMDRLANL